MTREYLQNAISFGRISDVAAMPNRKRIENKIKNLEFVSSG
jgi:hypothetical protein